MPLGWDLGLRSWRGARAQPMGELSLQPVVGGTPASDPGTWPQPSGTRGPLLPSPAPMAPQQSGALTPSRTSLTSTHCTGVAHLGSSMGSWSCSKKVTPEVRGTWHGWVRVSLVEAVGSPHLQLPRPHVTHEEDPGVIPGTQCCPAQPGLTAEPAGPLATRSQGLQALPADRRPAASPFFTKPFYPLPPRCPP